MSPIQFLISVQLWQPHIVISPDPIFTVVFVQLSEVLQRESVPSDEELDVCVLCRQVYCTGPVGIQASPTMQSAATRRVKTIVFMSGEYSTVGYKL